MDNRTTCYRPIRNACSVGVLLCAFSPVVTWSAGVSNKVNAEPGDIVVMRTVPARPAARQAPPSRALMINPKPNGELLNGLGAVELSDSAYASISAGERGPVHSAVHDATSQLVTELGSTAGSSGLLTGAGAAGSITGAVGGATAGIGSAVTGAVAGAGLGAGLGTGVRQ